MLMTDLTAIARRVRVDIIRSTTAAGSGHLTSSLSAVELVTGLLFGGVFRADLKHPRYPNNDRLVFSKGHAAPLLYSAYAAAGALPRAKLGQLRRFGSPLEGHPMPGFRYTEAPTGSLGQGLGIGVGEALVAKIGRLTYRTYVLLGDSEMAEGSVWEAIQLAGHYHLDNLVAILDCNGLGQSGVTMLGRDTRAIARRVTSFGWTTLVIDGHDLQQVTTAYRQAQRIRHAPVMIIAKTIKGKGVSMIEGKLDWHGRVLDRSQAATALKELGPINERLHGRVASPVRRQTRLAVRRAPTVMKYKLGESVAPRVAVGRALVRLGRVFPHMIVLDGEVKNSTSTELFEKKYKKRFVEGYIAEQNLVSMCAGMAARGWLPVFATFAAFMTRAYDQLRMNQYARTHQVYIGTHPGVHIGQDGPSQMGLQDIAMFRTLERSTILYPADAVAAEALTEKALKGDGLVYVRATRAELPVLYPVTKRFTIGGNHVWRRSPNDVATIVAAGSTLHAALAAADQLGQKRINVRVIDLYSIKPLDLKTLKLAASQTKRLVVVEDHYPEGGIAEAIRSALGRSAGCVTSLAVRKTPQSGTPEQLLSAEGLDAESIVRTIKKLIKR
ncbi:MAG: transketolase [Candidatus Kerfeldbacteria bacterium]|nr:transketolase [Candidatus Kerfeldbacteria bacterium]